MTQYTINSDHATLIAIDQHARSCSLSALVLSTGEARRTRLSDCPTAAEMVGWAAGWATQPYLFAYESGPCGFSLQRDLTALGHDCEVIAVTSIARDGKDKLLKDDRRDADRLLAEMTNPASKARAVWVPDGATEALRDLTRAYYDAVAASRRSKLQASAFLLRHGHVWNERTKSGALKKTWTADYRKWLHSIAFDDPRAQETFGYYVKTAEEDIERAKKLAGRCRAAAGLPGVKPYVDALSRLKGVDALVALAFAASVGDFARFGNGRSVSSYFGLTPTKHDSGPRRGNNGRITKAGDASVRKAVVEAIAGIARWDAGPKPGPKEGHGVSPAVEAEALKCNVRLVERYGRPVANGKPPVVARTAVASEMVRDMWAIGLIVRRELGEGA
ncbi:MAG: IS110 family transposase [Eggerthellaceae bacterium]|nr:IS110 family transposase [Eggerthellaceae bacterium]